MDEAGESQEDDDSEEQQRIEEDADEESQENEIPREIDEEIIQEEVEPPIETRAPNYSSQLPASVTTSVSFETSYKQSQTQGAITKKKTCNAQSPHTSVDPVVSASANQPLSTGIKQPVTTDGGSTIQSVAGSCTSGQRKASIAHFRPPVVITTLRIRAANG